MLKKNDILLYVLLITIFVVFVIKIFSYYIEYKIYQRLSLQNTIYQDIQYAKRGSIYDRHGEQVIGNMPSYHLAVIPSQITEQTDTNLICDILQISKLEWKSKVHGLTMKNNPYRESIFQAYLPLKERCAIEENLEFISGFYLRKILLRNYVYPVGFHAFGYISDASEEEVNASHQRFSANSLVGRGGVEEFYDPILRGIDGEKIWLRNSNNKIVQPYNDAALDKLPIHGKSLSSTIDIELQLLAEKLMQNKRGAIIAIEPKTGEILCLVSSPSINPVLMRTDMRSDYYHQFAQDPHSPLLNRVIQGRYSPASIFKIVEALIAVNNGIITPDYGYNCTGSYTECTRILNCEHKNPGHARDLHSAIVNSCNSYFINLFNKIWTYFKEKNPNEHPLNSFKKELQNLGIGGLLASDFLDEKRGFIPDSSFYQKLYGNNFWNFCTVMSLGIGQGELLMTPLQIANLMAIVANRGFYIKPHLIKEIRQTENKSKQVLTFEKLVISGVQSHAYEIIIDAMKDVVQYGTASASKVADLAICGKTGTVENYGVRKGVKYKKNSTAIFAGFAPAEDPKICFAVVVENAGFASSTAAPIASLLAEKYIRDTISSKRKWLIQHLASQNFLTIDVDDKVPAN